MIAQALLAHGHSVTWWIADFEHRSKTFRRTDVKKQFYKKNINFKLEIIKTTSYNKHISIKRIIFEIIFGINFIRQSKKQQYPDIIILADPSLFYGPFVILNKITRRFKSIVILDILDLWPEQFNVLLPNLLLKFQKIIFLPFYIWRRFLLSKCSALIAVSEDHLKPFKSVRNLPNLISYLGVDIEQFEKDSLRKVNPHLEIFLNSPSIKIVYAGTLGESYDIHTMLIAFQAIIESHDDVKFVIAGDGPLAGDVSKFASDYPDKIRFIGSIPADSLPSIYKKCNIGICSYAKNSTVTMPVKLFDYLAAGLAVAYSIGGDAHKFITEGKCGLYYRPESSQNLVDVIQNLIVEVRNTDIRSRSINVGRKFDSKIQHAKIEKFVSDLYTKFDNI